MKTALEFLQWFSILTVYLVALLAATWVIANCFLFVSKRVTR